MSALDALVINPGGRALTYQSLGNELTAIEPPLWSRLITGYLLNREASVDILDTEALHLSPEVAAVEVAKRAPRLAIIVVYGHQPSASTQTMMAARQLGRAIKAVAPDIPLLIVGGHVAALPERTVQEEPIDFACNGEGPETAWQLIQYLNGEKESLQQVAGLVWMEQQQVCQNPAPPLITDLDKELHGNVWHLLPMEQYRAHNWQCFGELSTRKPYASIYTTLGCPYKCVFCCINAPFNANKYRCRRPEAVVDEIEMLYTQYGVKTFKIIDEMFVLKKNHYLKICELLADKPFASELNIWAYARVDTVKEDTLALLRKAGIRWLALGIESADETVRDGANKSLSSQDIIDIVKMIQAADISVIGNFIFGLPHDTHESMRKTLDLAIALQCEFINFYSAMAYPGSGLYQQALTHHWPLPTDWDGYSQHSYHCLPLPTDALTAPDVLAFRDQAFHEYFEHKGYLTFVEQKFGIETRQHIEEMSETRLKRFIVEDAAINPQHYVTAKGIQVVSQ